MSSNSCDKNDGFGDGCDEEVPDYFEIQDMSFHAVNLDQFNFGGMQQLYLLSTEIDSAEQQDFRVLGELEVSNYGMLGDECSAQYGDLGSSELATEIKVVDVLSGTDLTSVCRLSEVGVTDGSDYSVDFNVRSQAYYNISDIPLDSLNNVDYRVSIPGFIITLDSVLGKGDYKFELTYKLETIEYVDTVGLLIN